VGISHNTAIKFARCVELCTIDAQSDCTVVSDHLARGVRVFVSTEGSSEAEHRAMSVNV